jgi:hypothetical protein
MNRKKKPSAIEELLHEKAQLKMLVKESEQNLNSDFAYIRENASSLLISGFTSLLFPSGKPEKEKGQPVLRSGGKIKKRSSDKSLTIFDWITVGKGFVPVVWEIVQPLVLTWGINKAKNWIAAIFTKKKKKSLRK